MLKRILNKANFHNLFIAVALLSIVFLALSGQVFLYKSANDHTFFLNSIFNIEINNLNLLWIGIGCYITAIIIFAGLLILKKFIIQDNVLTLFEEEKSCKKPKKILGVTFIFISIALLVAISIFLNFYYTYNHYLLILWLGSIFSGGLAVYFFKPVKPDLSFYKINLKEGFFLLTLIALFLSLVLPYINLMPRIIEIDEGNMGLLARTFTESTVNLMGYSDFYGIPNLSFFQIYLFSLPFGELDLFSLRYSAVLLGIITLIIFYYAAKIMFNQNIAAVSSIILVSSHVYIAYTRTAYHHFQGIFLFSLFMLAFILALKQKNNLLMFLSGVVLGFGFYLYYSTRVLVPILILYLIYLLITNFKEKKTILQWMLSGLFGFIIVISPLMFETLKQPDNFNARISDVYIFEDEGYRHSCCTYKTKNKLEIWTKSLKDSISGLFFKPCGGNTYLNTRPYLDLYSCIFFVLGFFLLCFMFKDYRYVFILISFLTIFIIGGSMTVDALCYQRVVIMLPSIAIIIGLSLFNYSENIANSFSKNLIKQIIKRVFIFFSIIIIIFLNFETYFNNKIITLQEESIFDTNTSAAYTILENRKKYDFYVVKSNYTCPLSTFHGKVELDQPPVLFLFNNKKLFHEIEMNENDLPIINPVKKDIAFIVSDQNLYINLNILLKQYPGGKVIKQNGGNGHNLKYFIYAVPKEIINSNIHK